jgi:hypothetical protein
LARYPNSMWTEQLAGTASIGLIIALGGATVINEN